MSRLRTWLVESKFTIAILSLILVLAAVIAALTIRLEVLPSERTPSLLFVTVSLENALPVQLVEASVTLPIEGAIRGLPKVKKITSSTSQNTVSISIVLEPKTNLDMKTLEIVESINNLGVSPYYSSRSISVTRISPDAQPVMRLAITGLEKSTDPVAISTSNIEPLFESLPGVARLEFSGVHPKQIEYRVDTNRIRQLGIASSTLLSLFRPTGQRQSVGKIEIGETDRSLPLFVTEPKRKGQDYSELQIKAKSPYVLRDIATVSEVDRSTFDLRRLDSTPVAFAELYNRQGADLFLLQAAVIKTIERLMEKNAAFHFGVELVADGVADLKAALSSVIENLIQAVVITFIVVWIGYRRFRDTTLICLSIPLTLLLTVLILRLIGRTLNILTLSGLTLCIGMVIDNAVLLIERFRELVPNYENKIQAAAHAAADALPALGIASLTNALIFLPVAFVETDEGFLGLLKTFQIPLLASLLVSVFAVVIMMPQMLRWADPVKKQDNGHLEDPKVALFRKLYTHRRKTAAGALVVSYLLWMFVSDIPTSDSIDPRESYQSISIRFENGLEDSKRKAAFKSIEKYFVDLRESVGAAHVIGSYNVETQNGTLQIYPIPSEDPDAAMNLMKERLEVLKLNAPTFAGVSISPDHYFGGGARNRSSVEYFDFSGPNLNALMKFQDTIREQIELQEGVRFVESAEVAGEKFVAVTIDPGSEVLKGVSTADISKEIQSRRGSALINDVFIDQTRATLKLILADTNPVLGLNEILAQPIQVRDAVFSLDQIGQANVRFGLKHSSRAFQRSTLRFGIGPKAEAEATDFEHALSKARDTVEAFSLPPGIERVDPFYAADDEEADDATIFLLGLSTVLIFLVLAGMFESIYIPVAIMVAVPIALLFGVAGLKFAGMELDTMGRLSLVLLVGAAVNNAIILVDQFRNLQSKGVDRAEAIIIGSASRLRAVIITAAIQILSVLPIALGQSTVMGIPYASLGVSMIAGMIGSTVVTLVVLPALYDWADSLSSA